MMVLGVARVTLSSMHDQTIRSVTREVRRALTPGAFAPARSRLLWLPVHLTVVVLATLALARHSVPAPFWPLLSLPIGMSFAGLTFLGHETLHGAVLRNKLARRVVGWLGFLPFTVSPRLWEAWHNRVHHGHTNCAGADPDAYPTLEEYRRDRTVRLATDYTAPGAGRLRGILSLLIGFSVQSAHMLLVAKKRGFLPAGEWRRALLESALGVCSWCALCALIGMGPFVFAFLLPLLIANAIVMSFILTNHSLSPLTETNDTLANSLTVTMPRFFHWLTLGFGFHVEHHLFPAMSARHAPRVRAVLQARFGRRYQSMSVLRATWALHMRGRVYKQSNRLIDPRSGREWPALG